MIKADENSLLLLRSEIIKQRDKFLLDSNEMFVLESSLEAQWDEEKYGSFRQAMDTIKGIRFDIDTELDSVIKNIDEMIDLAIEYRKIKF